MKKKILIFLLIGISCLVLISFIPTTAEAALCENDDSEICYCRFTDVCIFPGYEKSSTKTCSDGICCCKPRCKSIDNCHCVGFSIPPPDPMCRAGFEASPEKACPGGVLDTCCCPSGDNDNNNDNEATTLCENDDSEICRCWSSEMGCIGNYKESGTKTCEGANNSCCCIPRCKSIDGCYCVEFSMSPPDPMCQAGFEPTLVKGCTGFLDICCCPSGDNDKDNDNDNDKDNDKGNDNNDGRIIEILNILNATSFDIIINDLVNFIFYLAIAIAPLMLIIAGFLFTTAAGDVQKVAQAKKIITWTIIGFSIVLFSKGIVALITGVIGG
ncbi:MAG: pilin [Candidatus Nealsonbacteria bacterium]